MQTCFNMIVCMDKYFDVTVLMFQDKLSFNKVFSDNKYSFNSVKVYTMAEIYKEPKDIFRILPAKLRDALRYRWQRKRIMESVSSSYLHYMGILPWLLKEKFDFLMIEMLSDTLIYDLMKKKSPETKLIYQNHNVDSDMAHKDFKAGRIPLKSFQKILETEKLLYKNTDCVIAVSDNDASRLSELNNGRLNLKVVQTGISLEKDIATDGINQDNPKSILFCGSLDYQPNYEGLLWFYENCWLKVLKQMPELVLTVIGSGIVDNSLIHLQKDNTVNFAGRVDSVWRYYNQAAIVIVPLLSGSGIRIKILEAMSMGVPVVSTKKGAEGINYSDKENICIADDPEEFVSIMMNLLRNKEYRINLSHGGRLVIAENYDWQVIGKRIYDILNAM